jgi:hypothetical protein
MILIANSVYRTVQRFSFLILVNASINWLRCGRNSQNMCRPRFAHPLTAENGPAEMSALRLKLPFFANTAREQNL